MAALLLAKEGQVERAVEMRALAASNPAVARSRFWQHIVGDEIEAIEAGPPA